MKEQFADYETSHKIKDLGFDDQCFFVYDLFHFPEFLGKDNSDCINSNFKDSNICTRPTWHQVKTWLWEKYKIHIQIEDRRSKYFNCWVVLKNDAIQIDENFDSPIEAEKECIKQAVEYLVNTK